MPQRVAQPSEGRDQKIPDNVLMNLLRTHFEARAEIRRGVCLLNAAQYESAEAAFQRALDRGAVDKSLPSYLAACLLGLGNSDAAVEQLDGVLEQEDAQVAVRIRRALAMRAAGRSEEAIDSLREGIRRNPEHAELHLQLGIILASLERVEEAELRFTQAINIAPEHSEALVNLALCCGTRNAPGEALPFLQRAQARRPYDARIGMLLAQAAKAVEQQGLSVRARAQMPGDDRLNDEKGIRELAEVIRRDTDFVDAFLAIPTGQVDERVFAMLLTTLRQALRRQPAHAELHYQCGRVLARLGRSKDAIGENERAVKIKPTFTRALVELGKLYHETDRSADATTRLEQAIAAGAEYADVYYLLGNLYREQGLSGRARSAYRRALLLNDRYEAALKALEALPAA